MQTTTTRPATNRPDRRHGTDRRSQPRLRRPFDDSAERRRREGAPALLLTTHAQVRMSHRGLSRWDLEAVIDYGRESWQRGSLTYVVGRREVRAARAHGVDLRHVEGVHVVCSTGSMVVVTAYRNRSQLQLVA